MSVNDVKSDKFSHSRGYRTLKVRNVEEKTGCQLSWCDTNPIMLLLAPFFNAGMLVSALLSFSSSICILYDMFLFCRPC